MGVLLRLAGEVPGRSHFKSVGGEFTEGHRALRAGPVSEGYLAAPKSSTRPGTDIPDLV